MNTNIFKNRLFWIGNFLILIPLIVGLFIYPSIPETIPIHFDFSFTPDGYGPKWIIVFVIPLFMLLLNTFVWFVTLNDPKINETNSKILKVVFWIIPITTNFLEFAIYSYVLGLPFNLVRLVPLFIGVLFIILGNYLPKSNPNYTLGFRTPWAIENKENWKKTNRLGGYLMIGAGIVFILFTFFDQMPIFLFFIIILAGILIPFIYSYILYKRGI